MENDTNYTYFCLVGTTDMSSENPGEIYLDACLEVEPKGIEMELAENILGHIDEKLDTGRESISSAMYAMELRTRFHPGLILCLFTYSDHIERDILESVIQNLSKERLKESRINFK